MRTQMVSASIGMLGILLAGLTAATPTAAADGAFSGLIGSWEGSGSIKYTDGSSERMRCNAHYNGGASEVALSINCASSAHNIDLSGRLHASEGHVGGSWKETNFGLAGSAAGKASPGHLAMSLGGGVSGSMSMSFSTSHQDVSIAVEGAALENVHMALNRR